MLILLYCIILVFPLCIRRYILELVSSLWQSKLRGIKKAPYNILHGLLSRHSYGFIFLFLSYLINVLGIAFGASVLLTNVGAVRSMKKKIRGVGDSKQIKKKEDEKKSSFFDDEKVLFFNSQ